MGTCCTSPESSGETKASAETEITTSKEPESDDVKFDKSLLQEEGEYRPPPPNESSNTLHLLTYNVRIFNKTQEFVMFNDAQQQRIGSICDIFNGKEKNDHLSKVPLDVIALQELWAEPNGSDYIPEANEGLKDKFAQVNDQILKLNGKTGDVVIYYRNGLTHVDTGKSNKVFKKSAFPDSLAAKGVVYAKIQKQGIKYNIFSTHLQTGNEQKKKQLKEDIKELENKKNQLSEKKKQLEEDIKELEKNDPNKQLEEKNNQLSEIKKQLKEEKQQLENKNKQFSEVKTCLAVKKEQITEIEGYILHKVKNHDEVVILCGDFNSDPDRDPEIWSLIKEKFGTLGNGIICWGDINKQQQTTTDTDFVTRDESYWTGKDKNGIDWTDESRKNEQINGAKLIDHVFYHKEYKKPTKVSINVIPMRDKNGYPIEADNKKENKHEKRTGQSNTTLTFHDLSDHHALYAKIQV